MTELYCKVAGDDVALSQVKKLYIVIDTSLSRKIKENVEKNKIALG